jgi:hypothetical protein
MWQYEAASPVRDSFEVAGFGLGSPIGAGHGPEEDRTKDSRAGRHHTLNPHDMQRFSSTF